MFSFDELRAALPSVLLPVTDAWEADHSLRDAAVLAPIVERDGIVHVVYTLRRADLTHHAGEVSFPGGRRDEGELPVACALREFEEETGLSAKTIEVVGALSPRTSIARYRVQPLVGFLVSEEPYLPQEAEVDRVIEVPLPVLLDEDAWEELEVERSDGRRFTMPSLRLDDDALLWGLTARFTLDLIARLRGV
ncbi:MAG: CoA pyrophosphatase [Planctomycetes bacterium]|nr:CoA pyrophosphatase [Planctomycetota bacterium]